MLRIIIFWQTLWIHSYSPNLESNVPRCNERSFSVNLGPSSWSPAFFWFLKIYLRRTCKKMKRNLPLKKLLASTLSRENARAMGPSRLRRSLARSRETRFTRPNKRACSQARLRSGEQVVRIPTLETFRFDEVDEGWLWGFSCIPKKVDLPKSLKGLYYGSPLHFV